MVSVEHSAEGVTLEVERPEETVEAVVVDRVFFKPEHAEETLAAPGSASVGRPRSR
jgi:hypothetical protein